MLSISILKRKFLSLTLPRTLFIPKFEECVKQNVLETATNFILSAFVCENAVDHLLCDCKSTQFFNQM